jgi:DNA-binding transcriptional MerR regulator
MSDSNYTISDLETLSGIKAHTIRIWEKRYGVISPQRTETNIRFYSNDDLKHLLNISFLNKHGHKISKIADLNKTQIAEKVGSINIVTSGTDEYIDNLIVAMIDLDEALFEKIFNSSLIKSGFESTISNVIFPFLSRTGVMWLTGSINPAQEHFISNLIRQKLIVGIDSLPKSVPKDAPKAILFLPENELHESSLLLYNYMLKSRGYHTYYFGQSVPLVDLKRVLEITKADVVICVITADVKAKLFAELIAEMEKLPKKTKVLLSGRVILESKTKFPKRFSLFQNQKELLDLI